LLFIDIINQSTMFLLQSIVAVVLTVGSILTAVVAQATINDAYCQQAFSSVNGNKTKLAYVCHKGAISKCKIWKTKCAGVPAPVIAKAPAPVKPVVANPNKNGMMKTCCQNANVPQQCLQYCQYEVANPKEMACNSQCLAAMRVINACAANGKDNRQCCQGSSGFPQQCLSYCAGNAPTASVVFSTSNIGNYMPCFNAGMTIMQCHKQNATASPLPVTPYNSATTDAFPSGATNMVRGYCAIQTGNVLQAAGGVSSLGSLVNGFGG